MSVSSGPVSDNHFTCVVTLLPCTTSLGFPSEGDSGEVGTRFFSLVPLVKESGLYPFGIWVPVVIFHQVSDVIRVDYF